MGRARPPLLALASLCAAAAVALLHHGAAAEAEPDGGGVCGNVSCGMGTCTESSEYTAFGFACVCKPGWSRYQLIADDDDLQFSFLPCVIPNCTIHSSCQDDGSSSSPPPAPSPPPVLPPLTTFDPCLMQYCGGDGGTCEKASDFTHRCSCRDGYANLLNDTSYPCYQQCSLGVDCKGLGIDVSNGSTQSSSPPAPFSITIKKSAGARGADALLGLILLLTFNGLQAAIW